jgi:hypothetical protein
MCRHFEKGNTGRSMYGHANITIEEKKTVNHSMMIIIIILIVNAEICIRNANNGTTLMRTYLGPLKVP